MLFLRRIPRQLNGRSSLSISKSLRSNFYVTLFRSYATTATITSEQNIDDKETSGKVPHKKNNTNKRRLVFDNRSPSFQYFLAQQSATVNTADVHPDQVPYISTNSTWGEGAKYFIEVYGCQMNVNDTEILNSIMLKSGYERTLNMEEANVVFLVTCAIRESAETRIWERLKYLRHYRTKLNADTPPLIGVLGCMAERLKTKILDGRLADIVCGPDGYRSIPHLISLATTEYQNGVANVMLSADETYTDIMPVRLDQNNVSAWISIMRGCNNMCSFCIVPFTRGIERSRPIDSIVDEMRYLSEQGVKEVTLLGQNVNSYRDTSESTYYLNSENKNNGSGLSNDGFKTIYKAKDGGRRFTELLDKISLVDPKMRIRFTSPHPKNFPTELLHLIAERPNLCKSIHLPIQSGSNTVLERMRRGYTREAYLQLVEEMRRIIPDVWISSDFITGFCDETEQEHQDTVSLMKQVKYDMAFMFAYSMREKTHAHRRYQDNVEDAVKSRRLSEIIATFHETAAAKNQALLGSQQMVLIDSDTSKSKRGMVTRLSGRTDGGHKMFILDQQEDGNSISVGKGDTVLAQVEKTTSASLTGRLLRKIE
ncbi:tRNA-I(6)A37 thiotransferase enzyme MiaB [Halteromyces radiatus]|uniref:tRNA-I(6)A37 thiotransferase enzyme MiaB n=1 Tax=Halteromyces radiatus TaxID=101107 RepID=UPI002220F5BB|nr:tRNA-I(6)A37 thiotransferase enzyme MiaB [Halteromyces radiatus]KAI8096362.1 tRNA-I(6)A37 thiotransferase enzyme MiaB [Halteromyces radiatus]